MGLHDSKIRGIVAVMGDDQHRQRTEGLGSALQRMSEARERRGPVGVLDPFLQEDGEEAVAEPRSVAGMPRANQRRGLFRFSERAREAGSLD